MAELKDLNIFNSSKGIDKIKNRQNRKTAVSNSVASFTKDNNLEKQRKTRKSGAGAPIQNNDRVYATTKGKPIKVSALLHATSTVLGEKFMTEISRDEILRKALDQYIRTNLTKEDKLVLYNDVIRDLKLYREKNPTIPVINDEGMIVKNVRDIEKETEQSIKKSWEL